MMLAHCTAVLLAIINHNIVTGSTDKANSSCPLWHVVDKASGHCECCNTQAYMGLVGCNLNQVEVEYGHCMTWNNVTQDVEVGRCLFIYQDHKDACYNHYKSKYLVYTYSIPTNISGSELNNFICKKYNRKGAQCRQCIDGYGPAVFSDAITCADCSKHEYH